MSFDEARNNFALDAKDGTTTNNYLLMGDNAYGYTASPSNSFGFGDVDTYAIYVDIGYSYSVLSASASPLYTPGTANTNFALLDSIGNIISFSTDFGSYSGISFTATSQVYYISTLNHPLISPEQTSC